MMKSSGQQHITTRRTHFLQESYEVICFTYKVSFHLYYCTRIKFFTKREIDNKNQLSNVKVLDSRDLNDTKLISF